MEESLGLLCVAQRPGKCPGHVGWGCAPLFDSLCLSTWHDYDKNFSLFTLNRVLVWMTDTTPLVTGRPFPVQYGQSFLVTRAVPGPDRWALDFSRKDDCDMVIFTAQR